MAEAGRPTVTQHVHPLTVVCLATTLLLAAVTLPMYPRFGLTLVWSSGTLVFLGTGLMGVLWIYHLRHPGSEREWPVTELLAAIFALAAFTDVLSPAQYLAVALRRPLIDPWLAAADRAMGVDVHSLTVWTLAHRPFALTLALAYSSLLPQFIATPVILALWFRSRARLWEHLFHFHFCGLITVLSLALFPAACVFTYLGFPSGLNQTRFITHFEGLRAGTMHAIRFDDLEGLISMPSFHVAGALMSVWAVRSRRWLLVLFGLLNVALIASTVFLGAHYAVDIPASIALFAVSVLVYRQVARWLGLGK